MIDSVQHIDREIEEAREEALPVIAARILQRKRSTLLNRFMKARIGLDALREGEDRIGYRGLVLLNTGDELQRTLLRLGAEAAKVDEYRQHFEGYRNELGGDGLIVRPGLMFASGLKDPGLLAVITHLVVPDEFTEQRAREAFSRIIIINSKPVPELLSKSTGIETDKEFLDRIAREFRLFNARGKFTEY